MAEETIQTFNTIVESLAVQLGCRPETLRADIEERMQNARDLERVTRIAGRVVAIETREPSEVAAFFVAAAGAALSDPAFAMAIGKRMPRETGR